MLSGFLESYNKPHPEHLLQAKVILEDVLKDVPTIMEISLAEYLKSVLPRNYDTWVDWRRIYIWDANKKEDGSISILYSRRKYFS